MMVELIDDFFAEYPVRSVAGGSWHLAGKLALQRFCATSGTSDNVDTDEADVETVKPFAASSRERQCASLHLA